jgi:hypothetical protein
MNPISKRLRGTEMNAIPYEGREENWDGYDERDMDASLPGRPRRQFFNRWTAALFALLLGGVGFYVGIRVEKTQLSNSSASSRLAAAEAGTTGATGRSGTGAGTGRAGGGAGGFAGAFGGGGSASIGTVANVDGNTIYVTETSGNTIKVKLTGSTKITKSQSVGKNKINPGDSVVIAGVKGSNGSISAATVSDQGVRSTGFGGSGSSSSGNSGSGSTSAGSAVSSLFGSGGG